MPRECVSNKRLNKRDTSKPKSLSTLTLSTSKNYLIHRTGWILIQLSIKVLSCLFLL